MLSQGEIEAFIADGYVAVRGAMPAGAAQACQDVIWSELGDGLEWSRAAAGSVRASADRRTALATGSVGTYSCATRSWCTPRPGRTGAGSPG